jgi:hypothetical protein
MVPFQDSSGGWKTNVMAFDNIQLLSDYLVGCLSEIWLVFLTRQIFQQDDNML